MRHQHARLLRATLTASLMLLPMAETSYAKVGQFTGDDYLRHCTSNWTPQNKDEQEMAIYCVGFIEATITLIVAMDGRTYCLPVGATPQDVLKATVAFLQANPEQKQNLFAIVMMMAVQDHWPCH
jgi:Ssp1 endopeptidase immunity protein Rap1a